MLTLDELIAILDVLLAGDRYDLAESVAEEIAVRRAERDAVLDLAERFHSQE